MIRRSGTIWNQPILSDQGGDTLLIIAQCCGKSLRMKEAHSQGTHQAAWCTDFTSKSDGKERAVIEQTKPRTIIETQSNESNLLLVQKRCKKEACGMRHAA